MECGQYCRVKECSFEHFLLLPRCCIWKISYTFFSIIASIILLAAVASLSSSCNLRCLAGGVLWAYSSALRCVARVLYWVWFVVLYPGLLLVLISLSLWCVLGVICIVVGFFLPPALCSFFFLVGASLLNTAWSRTVVILFLCREDSLLRFLFFGHICCFGLLVHIPYLSQISFTFAHLQRWFCTLQTCIANAGVVLVNLGVFAIPCSFSRLLVCD